MEWLYSIPHRKTNRGLTEVNRAKKWVISEIWPIITSEIKKKVLITLSVRKPLFSER